MKPSVLSMKQPQMRGTLEYNQQRLMMVRRTKPQSQHHANHPSTGGTGTRATTTRLSQLNHNQPAPPGSAPLGAPQTVKNGLKTTYNNSNKNITSRKPWELPVSLPLRGRPVTIGDRTRDIFGRCDMLK